MSSDTDVEHAAPFSPELLAELHADALPEDVSSRLWPLVLRDEESMRVLAGLDAVTARLHEVGEDTRGTLPVPPEVAEQIGRTICGVERTARPEDHSVVVPLRSRRRYAVLGSAAAAALLIGGSIAFAALWNNQATQDSVVAGPVAAPDGSLTIDSADVDSGVAFSIIGKHDSGVLSDPADLTACLAANDLDPATTVLGSTQVRIDGRSGTLLVLAGPQPAQLIALAVGNDCSATNPDVLTRRDIG